MPERVIEDGVFVLERDLKGKPTAKLVILRKSEGQRLVVERRNSHGAWEDDRPIDIPSELGIVLVQK